MDARQSDKEAAKEVERLAKEQVRKKAWFAREKAMEEAQEIARAKRKEKRAVEEAQQLDRGQARKKDWLAREQAIVEATEARRFSENNSREGIIDESSNFDNLLADA
jgi:hypothetical protein